MCEEQISHGANASSCLRQKEGERDLFVEQFPSLKAVIELTDHAVEQMPLGLRVPVAALATAPVMGVFAGRSCQRCEGPQVACAVEPVVFYSGRPT